MTSRTSSIIVSIKGKAEESLKRAFTSSSQDAEKFGSKATGAFHRVATVASGVLVAQGARAAFRFGQELFNLGNELDTMQKKAETVFGASLGDITSWADEVNESLGISKESVVGLATNMSDLLKPMGFTGEEAANMSKEMIDLSGALSAWSGGTVDAAQVSEILTKAMLGERDQLKSLGIAISEADVQRKLAEKGQEGLTGAALEQAKALATQELIMEKSTDAQTAWADGTMDSVKAQNESKAAMEDAKASLAKGLVPVFQFGAEVLTDVVIPAIGSLVNFLHENKAVAIGLGVGIAAVLVPTFIAWAASAWAAAAGVIAATWPLIALGAVIAGVTAGIIWAYQNFGWFRGAVDAVGKAIGWLFNWIKDHWSLVFTILTGPFGLVIGVIQSHWDKVIGIITGGVEWAVGSLEWFIGVVSGLGGRLAAVGSGIFNFFVDSFKGAINWVLRAWNGLEFRIPGFDPPGPGPKFGGFTLGVPDIPLLAKGGQITSAGLAVVAESGPELIHLPRGADVTPLPGDISDLGGGGVVINQYFGHGTNPREAGRAVEKVIREYARAD